MIGTPLRLAGEDEEKKGSSLGDLFGKVKDIKIPEPVTNLPSQINDLKTAYLETAETVDELRIEVERLRSDVAALRAENQELRSLVGEKVKTESRADILKPIEVTARELVGAYIDDRKSADERFQGRYLKVYGIVAEVETGQEVGIFLSASGTDTRVRCQIEKGPDFHVDVMPSKGRIVSRNDRRTLLAVGQPVAVIGTCTGYGLNVEITNAHIDGISEKQRTNSGSP